MLFASTPRPATHTRLLPSVILVNASNPATRDFYGVAAAVTYTPRPRRLPVAFYIFRGGRYVNHGRGGVANVAYLGCHPGSHAAARDVTFVPPERCARRKEGKKTQQARPQRNRRKV